MQLQQRRLTSHLHVGETTFYLIIFFMIDRLCLIHTPIHLSIFITFTTTCMYTVVQYLQGGTMRYRHSRIHPADPRQVVRLLTAPSLPPSLPPPCQEKVYKHTLPHLSTRYCTSTSFHISYYYVHIHVQYIKEGTIMYHCTIISADERALTLISVIRAKIPRYIPTYITLPYLHHTCDVLMNFLSNDKRNNSQTGKTGRSGLYFLCFVILSGG